MTATRADENTPSPDPTRAIWRQIRRVTQPSPRPPEELDSPEKRMQEAALVNKRSLGALTLRNVRQNDEWHEEERRRVPLAGGRLDGTTPSLDRARRIWEQIRRVTRPSRGAEGALASPEKRVQLAALRNQRSLGAMTVSSVARNDAWYEVERAFGS